jgi:glycosyltransferase involved in cell wall biosynthesis
MMGIVNRQQSLRILGTRGIPAAHGGFETFAEYLALYLAQRGWQVTVYCQQDGEGAVHEDVWEDVRRVHIPVSQTGSLGTILFDWKSTLHAARERGLVLTLGYNTAVFCALYRLKGVSNLINMDGIEWKRAKWSRPVQAWFWINERFGCWFGNHLIADNPGIADHLATRVSRSKITMIPYGADTITAADPEILHRWGLQPGNFATLIARPEPENSILEAVAAFSRRPRGMKLLVLGKYDPSQAYHKRVLDAASDEVVFAGAIYDKDVVKALRFYSALYVHGHQVGGTNPSLVEALGAGNAVLAHGNPFNRWVAGPEARYFMNEDECAACFDGLLGDAAELARMSQSSRERHGTMFTWEKVLAEYEKLLVGWLGKV